MTHSVGIFRCCFLCCLLASTHFLPLLLRTFDLWLCLFCTTKLCTAPTAGTTIINTMKQPCMTSLHILMTLHNSFPSACNCVPTSTSECSHSVINRASVLQLHSRVLFTMVFVLHNVLWVGLVTVKHHKNSGISHGVHTGIITSTQWVAWVEGGWATIVCVPLHHVPHKHPG